MTMRYVEVAQIDVRKAYDEALVQLRLMHTVQPQALPPHSALPSQPGPDQLLELNLTPEMVAGKKFFYGKGCDTCNNTGYKGRMGIHELLVMTDELRDLIAKEASTDELRDLCVKSGMKTLRWSGVNAIHQGLTTMEEIIRETVTEE